MRAFLMSFNPVWTQKIKSGEKIYEYRQRFCDDDARVYMYITKPVMQLYVSKHHILSPDHFVSHLV